MMQSNQSVEKYSEIEKNTDSSVSRQTGGGQWGIVQEMICIFKGK
jgi:hypothetical protein